jgi:hypothetical protein
MGAHVKDKRDECGCTRDCGCVPWVAHTCAVPCVWPNCLTDADHDELDAELAAEEKAS